MNFFYKLLFFYELRHNPFPRNRFANINWENEIATGESRFVDENGVYTKQKTDCTEITLGEQARDLILLFRHENEALMLEILNLLNEIDNQIQAWQERHAIKQYAKQGGVLQSLLHARQYHVWMVDCSEMPPSIGYVNDHVNSEFYVSLVKVNGKWQSFWDNECTKPIQAA